MGKKTPLASEIVEQFHRVGDLNTKRILAYKSLAGNFNVPVSVIQDIFSEGIEFAVENIQEAKAAIGSENKRTAEEQGNKAQRHNSDKLRWSLVDFDALEPMVRVLEFGARKYSDHNWKKGLKTTEICESLLRHLTAYLGGEDNDPESGLPHTGHILCNAMFLSYMEQYRPDCDDRYRCEGKNGEVIVNWEVTKK